jgi:hypothetical protein
LSREAIIDPVGGDGPKTKPSCVTWGIAECDSYFIAITNLTNKSFFYLVLGLMIVDVCAKTKSFETKKKYALPLNSL